MRTQTLVREKTAVSKARTAWAREGGAGRRYSAARVRAALRVRCRAGWLPVVPVGTSPHERVTVLRRGHPLATVARACGTGQRWFERTELETALGHRLDS